MVSHNEYDEKADERGSPTLTHAPTVSDTAVDSDTYINKLQPELSQQQSQHLQVPGESGRHPDQAYLSETDSRDQATRLVDDLTLLQAEQAVSHRESTELRRAHSKTRSHEPVGQDVFNQPAQTPTIGTTPAPPPNKLNKVFRNIKGLPRIIRYLFYSIPVAAFLLIPVILGAVRPQSQQAVIGGPGGIQLMWFGIWLEVVWLSLWAARITTSIMPMTMKYVAKALGSGNSKKWAQIGSQLELHTAMFLWMLAVLISYYPILNNHKIPARVPDEADSQYPYMQWIDIVNKVIVGFFVLAVLNWFEKILIQWIAGSFHLRTYSSRIESNKQSIA